MYLDKLPGLTWQGETHNPQTWTLVLHGQLQSCFCTERPGHPGTLTTSDTVESNAVVIANRLTFSNYDLLFLLIAFYKHIICQSKVFANGLFSVSYN